MLVGQISLIGDIVFVELFLDVHLVKLHNSFLKLLVVREIVFDSIINIILELLLLVTKSRAKSMVAVDSVIGILLQRKKEKLTNVITAVLRVLIFLILKRIWILLKNAVLQPIDFLFLGQDFIQTKIEKLITLD